MNQVNQNGTISYYEYDKNGNLTNNIKSCVDGEGRQRISFFLKTKRACDTPVAPSFATNDNAGNANNNAGNVNNNANVNAGNAKGGVPDHAEQFC